MRKIIFAIASFVFKILSIFPTKQNRIILECDYGKGFFGNLLYIYKQIKEEKMPLEIIIPINSGVRIDIQEDNNTKIVKTKTLKHLYYLATSKYWITNNHYYHFLPKPKGTIMINTWHALGAFKKFGIDSAKTEKERERFIKDSKNIDYLLVSSKELKGIYSKALNVEETKILSLGIPRTDILFDSNHMEAVKEEFFNVHTELKKKNIILYAPTFRDDEKEYFNMQLDLKLLKENLGDGSVILLKLHPIIRHKFEIPKGLEDFIIDVSKVNINKLMIISDILITDYSSIIFEYSLLDKPIIFFAYDYEKYKNNLRNFYFGYEEFIPGKMLRTSEEVLNEIQESMEGSYNKELIREFSKRFCEYTDGKSTKRFINHFFKDKQ
ncbi:CDP-glycerol glycerophosphotransferase family protein [Hathewaya limosa]|uniref:CDP-ribitol ribitolphosphotransferase n=1 Tax=Hathewaya limosa TaxID=1536 RepID=A0ABU0JQV4_HATLI|nr:CDP-glycerol glycerophosphotransferase family protein [Hathewaya limosa]MDQ0479476.1 CDP-ribitol ribitolphosphotransferase [Hathewaya limosa]